MPDRPLPKPTKKKEGKTQVNELRLESRHHNGGQWNPEEHLDMFWGFIFQSSTKLRRNRYISKHTICSNRTKMLFKSLKQLGNNQWDWSSNQSFLKKKISGLGCGSHYRMLLDLREVSNTYFPQAIPQARKGRVTYSVNPHWPQTKVRWTQYQHKGNP